MSNKFSDGIDEIKKSLAFDFRKTTILDAIDSELTQLQNENERLMRRNDAQRILIQTLYQDLDYTNIDDAVKSGMVAILEGLIAQLKSGGN
jgi:hypothetical protein